MAALCRDEHNAIDRNLDPELRDELRWLGVWRLAERLHITVEYDGDSALEAARWLVREADACGITHPDFPVSTPHP
jgi:hypothetical protein